MKSFIFDVLYYLKIFQTYLGRRMYYVFLLALFAGLAESIGILLLIPIFQGFDNQIMGDSGSDEISLYVHEVILEFGLTDSTVTVLSIIAFIFIIKGFIMFAALSYDAYLRSQLISELRRNLYKLYNNMRYEYYTSKDTGHFVNLINAQIKSTLESFDSLTSFVTQFIFAFVYVSLAFVIAWRLGLMALVIGFTLFLLFKYLNRYVIKLSRRAAYEEGNLTKLLIQALHAFKYLVATNQSQDFSSKIGKSINHLADYQMRSGLAYAFTSAIREPITVVSMVAIMVVQILVYEQPLAPILISVMLFYRGLNSILGIQSSWQRTLESIGSMELVHQEFKNQKQHQVEDGKNSIGLLNHHIKLDSLFFSYKSNENEVIKNVNVKISANTSVAFIGHSGSGKSTLLDLITLMIQPRAGKILIDNIKGSDILLSSWRKQIGFVSQDAVIFDDSIANNICLCNDDFDKTQEIMIDVKVAAKKAHLDEFIEGLPQGYNTMVGDRGVLLSGGQRQRLFIARELYRKPRLLILDEATSALDSKSESKIQQSIDELKGSVTVIIVAHRLSTIQNVDYVYIMENGTIVENGSYSDLKSDTSSRLTQLIELQRA